MLFYVRNLSLQQNLKNFVHNVVNISLCLIAQWDDRAWQLLTAVSVMTDDDDDNDFKYWQAVIMYAKSDMSTIAVCCLCRWFVK